MLTIDLTRGVDVFSGKKLLEHFSGEGALEAAKKMAAEKLGRYVRYWAVKGE
jgi:hypothetical protein